MQKYRVIDVSSKGKKDVDNCLTYQQACVLALSNPNLRIIRMQKTKW
jgi:hypothetical protein